MPKLCIATMSAEYNKDTKLTSVFLKMSPNLSWNSPLRLRAAYDAPMAAMVVAGIVS